MGDLSPHFDTSEGACKDGCGYGSHAMDYDVDWLTYLEDVRDIYGRPLVPNSWKRCPARNTAEGGVDDSEHLREATDFRVSSGRERYELLIAAVVAAIKQTHAIPGLDWRAVAREVASVLRGVGIARTFVHLDPGRVKPRPSAWGYGPEGGGA